MPLVYRITRRCCCRLPKRRSTHSCLRPLDYPLTGGSGCAAPGRQVKQLVRGPPSYSFSTTVESSDSHSTKGEVGADADTHNKSPFALKVKVPYQLKLAAASLVEIWEHMDGWGIDDISIGLAVLWRLRIKQKRDSQSPPDEQLTSSSEVDREHEYHQSPQCWIVDHETDLEFVQLVRRMLVISHATYDDSEERVLKYLTEKTIEHSDTKTHFEVIQSNFSSRADEALPSYVLGVCHQTKNIILSVRGTWSIDDVLLNVMAAPRPFHGGLAHRGMLRASEAMTTEVAQSLRHTKETLPHYGLITTGHSMGAGIAALAAISLREEYPFVKSFGFSPPACVSLDVAVQSQSYIYSFVHGDDVTPRFHVAAMEQLREELYRIDWRNEVLSLAKESWEDVTHYVAQSIFIQSALQRGHAVNSAVSKWFDHLNYRTKLLQHLELIEQNLRRLTLITESKSGSAADSHYSTSDNMDTDARVTHQLHYINKLVDASKKLILKFNVNLGGEILKLQDVKTSQRHLKRLTSQGENQNMERLSQITEKFRVEVSSLWSTLMARTRHWRWKKSPTESDQVSGSEVPARMEAVRESVELLEEALDGLDGKVDVWRQSEGDAQKQKSESLRECSNRLTTSLLQHLSPFRSRVYRTARNVPSNQCTQNQDKVEPAVSSKTLMQYYCAGSLYHLTYRTAEDERVYVELLKILPHPRNSAYENSQDNGKQFMPPTHHRYFGKVILSETMISDHFAGGLENHFELIIEDLRSNHQKGDF